jgi:hypothetical protein
MLNSQTLVAALPLTERLEAAGFSLHPIGGTPLEAMCNATRSDPGLYDAAAGNVEVFVSHVAAMANKTQAAYGVSHHTATLDPIAELAITSVKKHLFFAKTVVSPTINDLYTRVKASLAEVNGSARKRTAAKGSTQVRRPVDRRRATESGVAGSNDRRTACARDVGQRAAGCIDCRVALER